jgi:hypothetical protein
LAGARLVAATHFAFVAFLVGGGPLGRRYPRVRPAHLAAIAATVAINLTGSDCPLTSWETRLLRSSGREPYERGFISHYLVEPFHPAGIDGRVNLVLLSAWMVPTAISYRTWPRRKKALPNATKLQRRRAPSNT